MKGFTLLETLVALFLLVIVSAALYSSYFTVVRARETALSGAEQRREVQGTQDLLRREIAAAMFVRDSKILRFVAEDRDIFGKPASTLTLTTLVPPHIENRPASDVVEVTYRVAEKDGKLALMREARDVYLSLKSLPYPQVEQIEGFSVECFDGGKWVKSWDTTLNFKLPQVVRITLRVKDRDTPADYIITASPRVIP